MMLTDLADVVRRSGLKVVEVSGWKTRGHGQMTSVEAIICHHTAGPETGNYPSLGVVRDGRPGLDGPLSQLGLGRDGTVYVIAAGVSYHAGATFYTWQNNWHAIGIEAEATGTDPWPKVQYDAYVRLCRALVNGYGVPVSRVLGHKEVAKPAGRKPDPNFDMAAFRAAVSRASTTTTEGLSVSDISELIEEMKRQGDATRALIKQEGAAARQETRRQAIWGLRYGLQIADDLETAADRYDATLKAGGTVDQAEAAYSASMSDITADLQQRAADNG